MAIFGDIQERLKSRVARGVSSEGASIKVLQPFEVDGVAGGTGSNPFAQHTRCLTDPRPGGFNQCTTGPAFGLVVPTQRAIVDE